MARTLLASDKVLIVCCVYFTLGTLEQEPRSCRWANTGCSRAGAHARISELTPRACWPRSPGTAVRSELIYNSVSCLTLSGPYFERAFHLNLPGSNTDQYCRYIKHCLLTTIKTPWFSLEFQRSLLSNNQISLSSPTPALPLICVYGDKRCVA